MPRTVILGAARTPIGKLGGGLASARRDGSRRRRDRRPRSSAPTSAPEQVQHVVMGQVLQAGQGQIPSRQAQIEAGIPKEVTSETINKVCASGVRAVGHHRRADPRRRPRGRASAAAWSRCRSAPYLLPGARFGFRMGDVKALDAMIQDGLRNPFSGKQMFEEATEVGDELEMTRADLDRWALRSHERAIAATDEGRLPEEIVPVTIKGRKGDTVVEVDEAPRRDTLARGARQARRALEQGRLAHGRQLAGRQRRRRRARARLRRVGRAQRQGRPRRRSSPRRRSPTTSPTSPARPPTRRRRRSTRPACSRGDIDLWEINEAFASVALNSIRMLGIDEDRVNVNGGAVALGHPIGASGARIIGALVLELRRRGGGYGCAAICSGGGQGDAVVLRVHGD